MSQSGRPAAPIRRWGRTFPNFARKSIPNSNPTTPNNLPPPSSTTAAAAETVFTSSPSTASPVSHSIPPSNAEITLPKLLHTTAVPQPQCLTKTLDSDAGLINSVSGNIDRNKNADSGKFIEPEKPEIEQSGSEKIIQVETASVVGSGDGNKNTAKLPYLLSHMENEGSVKPVMGPDIGADGMSESGNGNKKKKLVKKVVRVVKKVVKKRVADKVVGNDLENQGSMVEAEEGEVTEIPSFDNNEIEKSNFVDEIINKSSFVNEANVNIAENLNIVNDDVIEKSNERMDRKLELINGAGLSEPINGETSKLHSGASEQMVKINYGMPCVPDLMKVERVNHIAENVMETDICVAGLDWKKTKVDDIRKVFEEVGAVVEVRLAMFPNSLKNRGFAFVRFPTAADAKNALAKCYNVEICGKQCSVAPVGKISLSNLDKNWETKYVVTMLEKAGIEKIVKVTRKKKNSSAILEFGTSEDAYIAFNKLRKNDAFGKNPIVEVEWAKPDEEENLNVKSVYAEYLPSSWDEEKVREYFKRFGEIENVVMATDILSSRRKDSAFIHYTNRDAALRCIEVVNREILEDHSSKLMIAVSLANLNPMSKTMRCTPDQTSKQLPIAKPETLKSTVWSRLGTRGTEQSLSTSEISAELHVHDQLAPFPLKRTDTNSVEASPAKISARLHDRLAPIPLKRPASHPDEASPAKVSANLHDRLALIPLTRPDSHSEEALPAKVSTKLHDRLAPIPLKRPPSHSDEASPAKVSAKIHDRLAPVHLQRPDSHSDEASPAMISAKLHDRLAHILLKRPASHSDESSPAKKSKGLSGSTSPASPASSPITTGVLNLADGKMLARYIQSLYPSPDLPILDKMGDTELIDSYCLDQSKAMAKLAVIVSRSQRGFTNPELTDELNSLKKDNAELRSELEKSQTVILRLMDVAGTFRTRAKSQEGEIKSLQNENATLRAEMGKLQADCTKRIDEARTELALISRSGRSQRGPPFVWRNLEPSL